MKKTIIPIFFLCLLVLGDILFMQGKSGHGEEFLIKAAEDSFYGEIKDSKIDCIGFNLNEYQSYEEHRLYWFIRSSKYTDPEYLALDVVCNGKDRFRLCQTYYKPTRIADCAVVRWSNNYTCFLINNPNCVEIVINSGVELDTRVRITSYPFIYCHHSQYPSLCSFEFLTVDGAKIN